ncbi:MAG: NAD+ synthase [Spirochaeta sp.]|nr:NAD+ synthase [Spirochaeta sp.]
MKVALGQVNPKIGDFKGNGDKILGYIKKAAGLGAELVVFPELCLCGYPPLDLLDQSSFVDKTFESLRRIQRQMPGEIGVVLGYVDRNRLNSGKRLINAASLLFNREVVFTMSKSLLPTYDVFDEARYFEPADSRKVFAFKGLLIGLAICEDLWWEKQAGAGNLYPLDPVKELLDRGATLVISPSASPFHSGKPQTRLELISRIGRSSGVPVVYVNMVGGNDSLVFDGQSMVTSNEGRLIFLGKGFEEELALVAVTGRGRSSSPGGSPDPVELKLRDDSYDELERALILGLRDYVKKCGFERVHLGLSGGIDSAVVAVLAVRALGNKQVTVFALPSGYSSEGSIVDAGRLAANLGIALKQIPIELLFQNFLRSLEDTFAGKEADVTEENLQARIRGTLLMAYSNKFNSLLLATGNKSELATGYSTLYGDMCGGLAVIGDLLKTEVYGLARSMNRDKEIIPAEILTKPPSAELRPDQVDQDSLPPYEILDRILSLYLIDNLDSAGIAEQGLPAALVKRVITLVERAEYKRRQAPPVIKVSSRAFGTGRRIPIARTI